MGSFDDMFLVAAIGLTRTTSRGGRPPTDLTTPASQTLLWAIRQQLGCH